MFGILTALNQPPNQSSMQIVLRQLSISKRVLGYLLSHMNFASGLNMPRQQEATQMSIHQQHLRWHAFKYLPALICTLCNITRTMAREDQALLRSRRPIFGPIPFPTLGANGTVESTCCLKLTQTQTNTNRATRHQVPLITVRLQPELTSR